MKVRSSDKRTDERSPVCAVPEGRRERSLTPLKLMPGSTAIPASVNRIRRKPPSGFIRAGTANVCCFRSGKKYLSAGGKMMIIIPDYDNYVEHMKTNHPRQAVHDL